MAEPLSKTAYLILGMLQLGKRTGYEIKSLVDVSTRFFWAASYGQIYPEFARLEQAGLIRAEPVVADSRGRKAYQLTDAGEAALRHWLLSPEALHLELRHEGALKLFFSDALPREERVEPVRQMRAAHEQILQQLEGIASDKDADGADQGAPRLCLEWGIAYQEFMIDWCSKMERRLAAEEPAGKGA
jgi:PadR family transcriptional regulator, regulatory protein AphA